MKINRGIDQTSFGRIKPQLYDKIYELTKYHNGYEPDSKIINVIKDTFISPAKTKIADIGAGDGRNALPLAHLCYNIDAFEISKSGREIIKDKAKDIKNLKVSEKDILDTPFKKAYDAIFMSHVTQHFKDTDMVKIFQNISDGLKQGGLFIFDALLDKPNVSLYGDEALIFLKKHNFDIDKLSVDDALLGQSHFKKTFIEEISKKNNLNILSIEDFNERPESFGDYYKENEEWGMGRPSLLVRNVDLKWLTLKKV